MNLISSRNLNKRKIGRKMKMKLITAFLMQSSSSVAAFHATLPQHISSSFLCSKCLNHQSQRMLYKQFILDDHDGFLLNSDPNSLNYSPYDEMKKINTRQAALSSVLHAPNEINLNQFHRPTIIGHRGSVYEEPENTLRGFEAAYESGCEGVELDVFLLKCGTLIAFHGGGPDEDPGQLLDYCGVNGNILDFTAEEARELKFSPTCDEFVCPKDKLFNDNAFIPTLKEVLEASKKSGYILKLELKGPGTAEPVLNLVEEMDMAEKCHFSSFNHERIARIRQLRPEKNVDGTHKYKTGALFKNGMPDNYIELAMDAGASEVHLKYDTATKEKIEAIHDAGMNSMVWFRGPVGMKEDATYKYYDVGNEDENMYLTLLSTGVQSLCVNRPNVLSNLLDKIEKYKKLDENFIINIGGNTPILQDIIFDRTENRTEFLSLVA